MKRTRLSIAPWLLAALLAALLLAACQPVQPAGGGTVPAPTPVAAETQTLFVNSERVPCTGVGPMLCLQVRENEQDDWQFFYSGIDGFFFVPGFRYEIIVSVTPVENPPADGSSLAYTLVEVVSKTPANDVETPLVGTQWMLRSFGEEATVAYDETVAPILLEFGADGSLSGSGGCNRIIGSYTDDGSTLTFGPVGTTMMMCEEAVMAAEQAFTSALEGEHAYTIDGDMLQIVYAAGQFTFQARPPVGAGETGNEEPVSDALPLQGTEWTLSAVDAAFAAAFDPADTLVTMTLGADQSVAGTSGCNQYGGEYGVEGDVITFGVLFSTMMACDEAHMAVEQAFLAALQAGPATFVIEGNTLTLTTAGGVLTFTGAAAPAAGSLPLTNTDWTLVALEDWTGTVAFDPAAVEVTLLFNDDASVSGTSGCNRFNGGYTDDGSTLTFTPFATTRMMCAEEQMVAESVILAALDGSVQYSIAGSTLTLTTASGVLVYEGVPSQAAKTDAGVESSDASAALPFFGTEWTLVAFDENMGVAFDPAAVTVNATFNEDLSVTGTSGCNRFFGGFTLDGTLITFGPLAGTMMACEEPAMSAESAVLGALQGEALYQISGDTLELITGVGTLTFVGAAPVAEEAPAASDAGAALIGTTWKLTAFDENMGVAFDPAEVEATITFADDGTVYGSGGCNNFSGGYTLDGTIVTFGAIASTMMMCEGPGGTVEAAFLPALAGDAQAQVSGSTLDLITGVGTLTFEAQ